MPSQRFLQLPQEKRSRIMAAAVAEFSRVPYDEVSINKIVQAADIPRGSFYQYFKDKDDLLGHILSGYRQQMRERLDVVLLESRGDVFAFCRAALADLLAFGQSETPRRLLENLFLRLKINESENCMALAFSCETFLANYQDRLDLSGFKMQEPQEVFDAIGIVIMLLKRALVRAFTGADSTETITRDFERELEWIKYGIWKEDNTHA